jgi:hypothetical protein
LSAWFVRARLGAALVAWPGRAGTGIPVAEEPGAAELPVLAGDDLQVEPATAAMDANADRSNLTNGPIG